MTSGNRTATVAAYLGTDGLSGVPFGVVSGTGEAFVVPFTTDSAGKWTAAAEPTAAATATGAFALTVGSRDAALVVTLAPGAYTALVSASTTGVALVEVYEIAE